MFVLSTKITPVSMTLGTGFVGRSAIGENLEPGHLVNWTRVAYNSDASVPFDDFAPITAWGSAPDGPVPGYPHASNLPAAREAAGRRHGGPPAAAPAPAPVATAPGDGALVTDAVREQLRALIIEELQQLVRG